MKLAVQGIGIVSCYGEEIESMTNAFKMCQSPTCQTAKFIQGQCQNKYMVRVDTSELSSYLPPRSLRRIDHHSRMALLGAGKAMKDAEKIDFQKERMGLIVASGYGALQTTFTFLDSFIEKGDRLAFPIHFSNSVHNAPAAHIASCYKIIGPTLTVSQFEMSFFSALITAGIWIKEKRVDHVLLGCTDEYCDVLGYCIQEFSKSHNDSSSRNQYYFAGEGAVFFILTAKQKKSRYGHISNIFMGRGNAFPDWNMTENSPIIFSQDSAMPCKSSVKADAITKYGGSQVFYYGHNHFPTDSAFCTAYAAKLKTYDRMTHIKIGRNNEYGRVVIERD